MCVQWEEGEAMSVIKVEYDGAYPNLCSGHLVVTIDGKRWEFSSRALSSGGGTDWRSGRVTRGPWTIYEWPEGFPGHLQLLTVEAVNEQVEQGCCGGCL
jgi:hypothetical protein